MDFFVEQLIKEQRGGRYFLSVLGLTVAALLLITFAVMFLPGVSILVAMGVAWGWIWATRMLITEYEYCVTNGDIDIDRIRGRSKRLRLVSVRGEKIESLAPCKAGDDFSRYNRVVHCHSGQKDAPLWCFTYHSKKNGHTVVIFEPDERVLPALVEGLPYLLQRELRQQYDFSNL